MWDLKTTYLVSQGAMVVTLVLFLWRLEFLRREAKRLGAEAEKRRQEYLRDIDRVEGARATLQPMYAVRMIAEDIVEHERLLPEHIVSLRACLRDIERRETEWRATHGSGAVFPVAQGQ